MHTGMILWLVALTGGGLAYAAKKRYPDRVTKSLPYLYMVMGCCFVFLDAHKKALGLGMFGGIAFIAYGLFLLWEMGMNNRGFKDVE